MICYAFRKRNLAIWIRRKLEHFRDFGKDVNQEEYCKFIKMILSKDKIIFEDLQEIEYQVTITEKEIKRYHEMIAIELTTYWINRALEIGTALDEDEGEKIYKEIKPNYYNGSIEIMDMNGNKYFINIDLY